MGRRSMTRWLAAVALLVGAACGGGDPAASAVRRGEVVEIPPAELAALEAVTPEVVLTIDGDRPEAGPLLTYISDVARAADGTIVLLDAREQGLHLYRPDGEYLRTLGGRGEGPGEFSRALMIAVVGDTVAVWESSTRLHLFTLDGTHLTTERVESGGDGEEWTGVMDLLGTPMGLLAMRSTLPPGGPRPSPVRALKPYTEMHQLLRWNPRTTVFDSLFAFPGKFYPVVTRGGPGVEMFGPGVPFAITEDGGIVRVPDGELAVEEINSGGEVTRTLVGEVERTPVTEAHVKQVSSLAVSQFPPAMREDMESAFRRRPVADHHPAILEILAGASSRVLVLRADVGDLLALAARRPTEQSWDYFSLDGEVLGRFLIPPTDRPVLLRDGYLHAVRTSPLGVPSLVVYDLDGEAR